MVQLYIATSMNKILFCRLASDSTHGLFCFVIVAVYENNKNKNKINAFSLTEQAVMKLMWSLESSSFSNSTATMGLSTVE